MRKSSRFFAVILLALIMAVATYAFAAANTVDESGAGDGAKAISGYTITAVKYTLGIPDPSNISSVSFNIAPTSGASAPTSVKIQLVAAGSWYSCTMASSIATCDTTGTPVTALAATNLRVVAAQ
jgi:hypothetical protein